MLININAKDEQELISRSKRFISMMKRCDKDYTFKKLTEFSLISRKGHVVDFQTWEVVFPKIKEKVTYLGSIRFYDGKPLIFSATEDSVEKYMIDQTSKCDFCDSIRKRNVYHIFNDNGTIVHIGSSCALAYYDVDIESLFKAFEKISSMEVSLSEELEEADSEHRFSRGPSYLSVDRIIYICRAITDDFRTGYVKELTPIEYFDYEDTHDVVAIKDEETRSKIAAYWKDKTGDFAYNVRSILLDDEGNLSNKVNEKLIKIAICGVIFALTKKESKKVKTFKPSNAIGEVGDTVTVDVEVVTSSFFESDYGTLAYLICKDKDSNIIEIKTNCSSKFYNKIVDLDKFTVKGFIKRVDGEEGKKKTWLQRCRLQ